MIFFKSKDFIYVIDTDLNFLSPETTFLHIPQNIFGILTNQNPFFLPIKTDLIFFKRRDFTHK